MLLATQDTFTALPQITVYARLTGSSSKHTEQPRSLPWAFDTASSWNYLCSEKCDTPCAVINQL